jgi:topoisomerase-4 subunit A
MPRRKPSKTNAQKAQKENSVKSIKLPISKLIDTKFREYALYVLSNRGIPSFYDGLTPVQRYILSNSPQSFTKTLSVVGDSIKDGYHHGDCLGYNTKINLADGTQVTLGEWAEKYPDAELMVRSIDEDTMKEVIGIAHSPRIGYTTDEYYEIEMENGELIRATPNHPFLVNGKWINAEDLETEMDIFRI